MGTRLFLFIVCIVFLLFSISACVSKGAYQQVQTQLAQTQQEKSQLEKDVASLNSTVSELRSQVETAKNEVSSVKSLLSQEQAKARDLASRLETSLSQEQAKVRDLTSQIESAKAEYAKLQNPLKPTLSFIRTAAEVSSDGQFTEKTSFKRGEAFFVVISGIIPVHNQRYDYSAGLAIRNMKTDKFIRFETLRPPEIRALPGSSTVSRVTWRRFDTQDWEPGQYVASATIEDEITGTSSQLQLTTFTIQ